MLGLESRGTCRTAARRAWPGQRRGAGAWGRGVQAGQGVATAGANRDDGRRGGCPQRRIKPGAMDKGWGIALLEGGHPPPLHQHGKAGEETILPPPRFTLGSRSPQ